MGGLFKNILPALGMAGGSMLGGTLGGAIGGQLGSMFGGRGRRPGQDAMGYMDQIPDIGKQYMNPFINRGARSGDILQGQYDKMSQNPTDFLDQIMSKYRPSSGYDFKQKQMLQAAGNTAAAGGFRGTENDRQGSAQMVQGLLGDDMQQYLQNIMGIQGTGLQGHQGFQNQGYDASGQLAGFLGNNLGDRAELAYRDRSQSNQNNNQMQNQLMSLAGMFMGGGMPGSSSASGVSSDSIRNAFSPMQSRRTSPTSAWARSGLGSSRSGFGGY